MSRFVRKQMLSIVEQLKIAAKRIRADEYSALLLGDCQEAAITLGTRIEKIRGEGTRTVSELEAYCEDLYTASEALVGGNLPVDEVRRQLAARLKSVEECLKEDMPDKLEIAFLPYNASMWDSLESVWMAARDDADCEDYVVPIPYYDKNTDGTLAQFHYEGDRFPADVPITSYEEYDLEVRHPDVIYIHNPYDDCNLITTVDMRFYARRIHFFTEKLVYIPYFVLAEPDPENPAVVDSIRNFAYMPGVFFADQVILQSENMRKVYLKVNMEQMTKEGIPFRREDLEKKFLGTGSPKFDRVSRAAVSFDALPEDWRRIITKPDGTHKKVIFYNTSIGAMLQSNGRMVDKIARVLQTFWEYREEVALLWRPHPLMEVNLKALRPELWNRYQQIAENYRKAGWGIYDNSSELDRAIALADAYFGDNSSVVQLCQKAGMPIMIQNADV